MARKIVWLAALSALGLLAGCGSLQATDYYRNESLNLMEQKAYQFAGDTNETNYSDTMVDISLQVDNEDSTAFQMALANKTSQPLVILWDQVVFIDADGNRQKVIHQGVRYWDPVSRLSAVAVPPFTNIRDLLRPAKVDYRDGEQRLAPLRGRQDTSGWLDQRISITLPLIVYDRTNLYRFRFHIESPAEYYDLLNDPMTQGP
ncbi:MAG: hypothetical protein LDL07_09355 [Desulfarculus sp.]|nr:hypothetical protein [Desulfarculus sp.]